MREEEQMSGKKDVKLEDIEMEIRNIIESESFAVLSTQIEGQPYANIIAFASSPNLKQLVFATSRDTRKFRNLQKSDRVAFLVDNRNHAPPSLKRISAITITGKAHIIDDHGIWHQLLAEKHPYLIEFINSPSNAIIKVDIYRYFYVRRFQEVFEWIP